MHAIQNQFWKITVAPETLRITLEDIKNHQIWTSSQPFNLTYGHCYSYDLTERCRARRVTSDGNAIHISLADMQFYGRFADNPYCKPEPAPQLEFNFTLTLDGREAVLAIAPIANMDDEILDLAVLQGLVSIPAGQQGGALFPIAYGSIIRLPRRDNVSLSYGFCNGASANMPLAALFRKNAPGIMAYTTTPWDMSFQFSVNKNGENATYTPRFEFEQLLANDSRDLRFIALQPGQDYNDVAKIYRQTLIRRGMFKTYQQKIAESPDAEKLVGTVVWKHNVFSTPTSPRPHSYSLYMPTPDANEIEGLPNDWTAKEVFDTAHAHGFDRVCIYNTGWNWHGYDSGYPRRLPPNPERGTQDQFTQMAQYARDISDGFIYSVHDNYIDIYKNSGLPLDDIVARTIDGAPLKGGIWRGGRAYIQCTQCAETYVKRDIPKIVDMLGKGGIYIDVFGCTLLHQCYNPKHLMSRKQDADARRKLFQFIIGQLGTATTESAPFDFLCDTIHMGAFAGFCVSPEAFADEPAIPVPFWQLVFHDAVLGYTSEGTFGPSGRDYMAFQALYALLPTQFDDESRELSQELRSTYTSELLRHEIGDDVAVAHHPGKRTPDITGTFKTTFADGTTVTAHFAPKNKSTYVISH